MIRCSYILPPAVVSYATLQSFDRTTAPLLIASRYVSRPPHACALCLRDRQAHTSHRIFSLNSFILNFWLRHFVCCYDKPENWSASTNYWPYLSLTAIPRVGPDPDNLESCLEPSAVT